MSLADHIHRFDSLKRTTRAVKRSKALARADPSLDSSVILLDDVVQVPDGSTAAAPAKFAGPLQFRNHLWIRRVSVDVDDPRSWMPG
jgi:hypothetical protein